jgi:hypothetical protein
MILAEAGDALTAALIFAVLIGAFLILIVAEQ